MPADAFGLGKGLVALHPDRDRLDSDPALGPVCRALVENCYPHEGRWLISLRLAQGRPYLIVTVMGFSELQSLDGPFRGN